MRSFLKYLAMASFALVPAVTQAQTTVPLSSADTSQTSTITATVIDQATVTIPSSIAFAVNNVTSSTTASTVAVSVSGIVTAASTNHLRISVQANAANFTPPVVSATTWAASDVSWGAGSWTNSATGSAGTLSSASYTAVVDGANDSSSFGIVSLPFTLAAKSTVGRSGGHTLVVTWKVEII